MRRGPVALFMAGAVASGLALAGCGGGGDTRAEDLTRHQEAYQRSDRLWSMGDLRGARAAVHGVLEENPRAFDALLRMGALLLSDDPDSALVYLERAAALAPDHPGPPGLEGLAHMLQSRFDSMNASLARAVELATARDEGATADSARALVTRADRAASRGDAAAARTLLWQSLDLTPHYAPALYGMGRMELDDSAYRSAALYFFAALREDPTVPAHFRDAGQTLMRMSLGEMGAEYISLGDAVSAFLARGGGSP